MKINEIFKSIQGEGKYTGHPVLFIRTSGCTRACTFCDTSYHNKGTKMSVKQIIKKIKQSKANTIVWTGGEPILWQGQIYEVILRTRGMHIQHHLETNGDILPIRPRYFNYISFSPKEKFILFNVISYCAQLLKRPDWDIKIVTDLKINKDMIEHATMLMPLTTYDKEKDKQIQKDVWNYCVKNNLKYTHRIHIDVWGQQKEK